MKDMYINELHNILSTLKPYFRKIRTQKCADLDSIEYRLICSKNAIKDINESLFSAYGNKELSLDNLVSISGEVEKAEDKINLNLRLLKRRKGEIDLEWDEYRLLKYDCDGLRNGFYKN